MRVFRSTALPLLAVFACVHGDGVALDAATLVVANKAEATVSLIDLDDISVAATLPTGAGPHEVAVSPDGGRALVTDYGTRDAPGRTLTLLDVAAGRVLATLPLQQGARPHGVRWLDGRRAAVTAEGLGALLVVDVDSGGVELRVETGQEVSHMVAVAPSGQRAYVANIGSGSVSVIDLGAGRLITKLETGAGAEGIDLALDGAQLWVTNREADTVAVYSTGALELLARFESPSFPIRARSTGGGRVLVTHARSGEIAVFDAAELRKIHSFRFDVTPKDPEDRLFGDRFGDSSVPIGVVVNAGGDRAWIAHANADVITEVDLESFALVRRLTAGREPDGMDWSPVKVRRDGS